MAFPFTIKYSKTFDRNLTDDEIVQVLFYIRGFVKNKSADEVEITDNMLVYKGSTSWSQGNLIKSVDKGVFNISIDNNKCVMTYEAFMYTPFYFISAFGVLVLIIFRSIAGLILAALFWLISYGVALGQHEDMFNEIEEGIDELLWPKPPEEVKELQEDDWAKGELKSWF